MVSCMPEIVAAELKQYQSLLNTEPLPGYFHMRNGYLLSSLEAWLCLQMIVVRCSGVCNVLTTNWVIH
jgi:hypothetical protein